MRIAITIIVILLLVILTVGHAWVALIGAIAVQETGNPVYYITLAGVICPVIVLGRRLFRMPWAGADVVLVAIGILAVALLMAWEFHRLGDTVPVVPVLFYVLIMAGTVYLKMYPGKNRSINSPEKR
ncbi:MAG: hypothetical protein EOP85_11940 [Verrucomicrobiaceae bacterium]|nr:MAG: hypothetical protein EOP85_11940 [Verrucomicrobiaceae bacterium]